MPGEQPLYSPTSPDKITDDPYGFDRPDQSESETSQNTEEEITDEVTEQETIQEDQPFYAKHGFDSEEAMVKALNEARNQNGISDEVANRLNYLENLVIQNMQPPEPEEPEYTFDREKVEQMLKEGRGVDAVEEIAANVVRRAIPPVDPETKTRNMIVDAMLDPNKPDFKELVPDIQAYLKTIPNLHEYSNNPLILDLAYNVVKLKKVTSKQNKQTGNTNSGNRNAIVQGRPGGQSAGSSNRVPKEVQYDTMFEGADRSIQTLVNMLNDKK